jgi:hypothetical protein
MINLEQALRMDGGEHLERSANASCFRSVQQNPFGPRRFRSYNATQGGDNVFTGHNDLWRSRFSARRTCASLPASCEVAETFFKTSVPAGENLCVRHLSLYDPTAALALGQVLSLMHSAALSYHSKICSPPTGTVKLASNGADVATSSTEVPPSPLQPCMTTLRALPHRSPSGLTTAALEEGV